MAVVNEFLQSPLVTWSQTFSGSSKPETVADFADGVFLNEIMVEIDPTYFTLTRVQHNVYGDINIRVQNLDTLLRHIKGYYQERLQQMVLVRIPDIVMVGHDPESEASIEELTKILLLMLGVAVQCEHKEHFIGKIKELDFEVQKVLVDCIKQVTDNSDNVLPFRLNEIAEYPVEQLLLMAETMYYHIGQLVDERDVSVGMITHLTYERDSLLEQQESHPQTPLSPPLSPRHSFKKTSPALTATKEKLRLLTEEVEEKNIMLQELREELVSSKRLIEKLRQDNKDLSQDARWVKAYRDEIDMLKAKADKVDRLEADTVKYKEKLRDLDYYKKRAEELKEQNELLYDTKVVLEEQLVGMSIKDERIEISEEANKKLKSHIYELAEERQFDQIKLKEIMEENAQLVLDKQNSMAELAALMAELDILRGKASPGVNSLASEYKEQSSVEVLRLQRENQQLRKSIDNLKNSSSAFADLERENQELRNMLKNDKSEVYSLNEELARVKAKAKQQSSDIVKLNQKLERLQHDASSSSEVLNLSGEPQVKRQAVTSLEQQANTHRLDSKRHQQNAAKLSEEIKANEDNIVRLKQQVKERETKEVKLAQQLDEKQTKIAKLTETVEVREKTLRNLEASLEESEKQQHRTENKVKEQRREISELENRVEEMVSLKKTVDDQVKVKDREIDELNSRMEDTTSQKNRSDENLKRREKDVYELKNRIEKLNDDNDRLAEDGRIKEQKIHALQRRAEELSSSLDEKANYFNMSLREKEKENKELDRRIESLADSVEEVKRLKDLLKQKDGKLESFNKAVQEKVAKLQDLETRLEDLDNGNKKLVHTLKLKENKIESLESSLAEVETNMSSTFVKDSKIAEIRKSVETKDNKILELENRLEDLVSSSNKLQHSLRLKEDKIQHLEQQIQELEEATAEKNKLSQSLDQKLHKILNLEMRNEDLTNDNIQLKNNVELKDGKMKSQEKRISELDESVRSFQLMEHDVRHKDERITSLARIIQEREEKLAELEHRFEDTQAHNHKLSHSVKIKEDKILALESRVEELEGLAAESQKLSQLLQQKEEKISVLDSKLDDLKDVLSENEKLAHNTKQKDEKIQRLQERLDEVEDAVKMNSRLNQTLKQRDEKIKILEARINELEALIESKEAQHQKTTRQYENRIRMLEKNIDEVSQAKVQRTNSVKRRDEKIVDLDKRRTALEEYIEEREGRIEDLQSKLEGSSHRFRKLDISVGEKEMRIGELEAKLIEAQDNARENRKLNQIMKTKDARIENLETKLQSVEGFLVRYKAETHEKSEKLDNIQKRLEETLNLNNKLDQSVRKKEENIRTLEKTLQSIEKREEELEEFLETKGEKLAEYKKKVLDLEDAVEEKDDKINEHQRRLDELTKITTVDQRYRVAFEEKQSRITELETDVKELELKVKSCSVKSPTAGEVEHLNNSNKQQEENIQELEAKLGESLDQNKKLDLDTKQKDKTIDTLQKRVELLLASQDTSVKSQSKILQQKDSTIATMSQSLRHQESEILSIENRLDETVTQVGKLARTSEQKEDRIKSLKARLEDAVHQNNKLNHNIELKDDKIKGFERRLADSVKEFERLRGNMAVLDRKPEREKDAKLKGSSSQTIIFKPANNTNNMRAVELLADAERRLEELNEEVRALEKQNATVGAQNEAMSARNASLLMENESLKNDLQNLKGDYSNLLLDVGEARDYYNQLDISASKMVHRCEMLGQLNGTLEEENKALMEQVTKLVSQNQDILVRSLDDKEQSMEDERLFSDRLFSLQREKERLEEQVELANRALAESTPTKKKKNLFKRGAHKMLKATGLKKKKDGDSNKKNPVQLLKVDHSPYREHFDSYRPVSVDLESESFSSAVHATPVRSRHDDSRSSFDSRESSVSGDSNKATNRLAVSQSEGLLRRGREFHTLPPRMDASMVTGSPADVVQLRRPSHDVSAYRARHARSEYFGDRDYLPGRLRRPKSLDALDKIIGSDLSVSPVIRPRGDSAVTGRCYPVQNGPSPASSRRELQFISSSPPTPTGARRSPPRQSSSRRTSPSRSPRASPRSSPIPERKRYPSPPPSPSVSHSSIGSSCFSVDTVPVRERSVEIPTRDRDTSLPSSLPPTVVRVGATFGLASPSSSSITSSKAVPTAAVSTSSVTRDPERAAGPLKSATVTPIRVSGQGAAVVTATHSAETDTAPIEMFVREMERDKELNRGSFRGSNRSLSRNSLRASNRSLNRVKVSTPAVPPRQGTTVYAVYSTTNDRRESINSNGSDVMIDATSVDVNITPVGKLPSRTNSSSSMKGQDAAVPARDSGIRTNGNGKSAPSLTSTMTDEPSFRKINGQREEPNQNYISAPSPRPRTASGRSITSQGLAAQTRNVSNEKTGVLARVREFEQQNTEPLPQRSIRSPSTSSFSSLAAEDDGRSRSTVSSDSSPAVKMQHKAANYKKKDETSRIQSKISTSALETDTTTSQVSDGADGKLKTSSTGSAGSGASQDKKISPVWYEYGCV